MTRLGKICLPAQPPSHGMLTCSRGQYCLSDVRRADIHWERVWDTFLILCEAAAFRYKIEPQLIIFVTIFPYEVCHSC